VNPRGSTFAEDDCGGNNDDDDDDDDDHCRCAPGMSASDGDAGMYI
jgi:hypothetical protein